MFSTKVSCDGPIVSVLDNDDDRWKATTAVAVVVALRAWRGVASVQLVQETSLGSALATGKCTVWCAIPTSSSLSLNLSLVKVACQLKL